MTDNDKNYIENSVLRVRLPMKASELERIIRVHCEHHGVWDDCIVKSEEDGNVETSYIREYADRIEAAHKRELAAKDEEILNLRKSLARVMEVTGDCRKCEECGDETCPWFGEPDGCNNREGRALFLAGKLVDPLKMKDEEIVRLRALVNDLASALEEEVRDGD